MSCQTLFFNHRSLDLTLSDLSKFEPAVSPDKPMGQLWHASSSVFEAQSRTNNEKSSGICLWDVPWVIRLITHGSSVAQIFPDNPFGLFTVCTKEVPVMLPVNEVPVLCLVLSCLVSSHLTCYICRCRTIS